VDVYSFGIVLCETFVQQRPWANTRRFDIRDKVKNGQRPHLPASCLKDAPLGGAAPSVPELVGYWETRGAGLRKSPYESLLRRCWAQNPVERPNFHYAFEALQNILKEYNALVESRGSTLSTDVQISEDDVSSPQGGVVLPPLSPPSNLPPITPKASPRDTAGGIRAARKPKSSLSNPHAPQQPRTTSPSQSKPHNLLYNPHADNARTSSAEQSTGSSFPLSPAGTAVPAPVSMGDIDDQGYEAR